MSYTLISKKELPKSLVEIVVEIPWAELAAHEDEVLQHFKSHLELPGFRKGNVPEAMVRKHISDITLIEEMAEKALGDSYGDLVTKEKIIGIGRPQVVLTKIARGNPLEARITVAVIPQIDLGSYTSIGKEVMLEEAVVTDADVESFIKDLQTNYARAMHSYGESHDHANEHKDEDLVLPELNDEFVKKLGAFADVADFKIKMRENLQKEKEVKARDKKRNQIAEKLIESIPVEVPEILIESELERMWGRMEGDIERSGLKVADYLKHIQKDKNQIKDEWKDDARKRAALQIIVAEIAAKENIKPNEDQVKENYDAILLKHPDTDPMRAKLYIEEILTNEAVFDFLEKGV